MEHKQRWQDWLNLILGIWLFFSPFVGMQMANSIPAWNGYIFGLVIGGLSLWALIQPQAWEEWFNLIIGIWLIVSPFIPGYTTESFVIWNQVVVGLIVGIDALWAALSKHPTPLQHA